MSRIVVKNLPKKATADQIKQFFSECGVITDLQLKYTKDNKFRQFGFIGYQKNEEAERALQNLNGTFFNASKIKVELCSSLGDSDKPRRWSKHAPDSLVNVKKVEVKEPKPKEKKVKKKGGIKDEKLKELISEHKDEPLFKEFIETHLKDSNILEGEENKDEENEDQNEDKLANQKVSDLEYLKSKMKVVGDNISNKVVKEKKFDLITLKISGLPFKAKKTEIKQFLQPAKPYSIRVPVQHKGIAYCGFKTQSEANRALTKNRSFLNGKRITITKYTKKDDKNEDTNVKWKQETDRLKNEETIAESGRIFVRNLSYTVTEDILTTMFEKYGPITDITLPIDSMSRKTKGFGIVTFLMPEHAFKAFKDLDGTVLQGRMLHLLPGLPPKSATEDDDAGKTGYKHQKLNKQKAEAGKDTNWNTLFIGQNALVDVMAATYNTSRENVLNDKTGGAAVRLALGETELVNKTKQFLIDNDVSLDAFNNLAKLPRSKTIILVKNLPPGTTSQEIVDKFAAFGELKRFVFPPLGVTAIVEYIEADEAKKAFRKLAYSKFKHIPLYLEWAPAESFKVKDVSKALAEKESTVVNKEEENNEEIPELEEGCILFVKNLNFSTTNEILHQHFSKCGRVVSAEVGRKKNPVDPDKPLSLGYGFVKFATKEAADKALKTLQHSNLEQHDIEIKRSNRTTNSSNTVQRKTTNTDIKPSCKILVRNIPFQATQNEVVQLFKVFGEIKATRLPKKMVGSGSHRGFAFVEYHTLNDAKKAFKALSQSTHLYGRRLVLEWAETEEDVSALRKKTAEHFHDDVPKKKMKKNFSIEEEPAES